ncbi:uncharacterized protein N7496_011504 [Penicillium cataractarum]|uniref:Uncharacterized protein n=1 Tax=Penicillium cataractarum TaxID=2100454 RepID=A0A9W9RFD6_9EURO|nr:uncharacterized protein N7496_011504 [Penicillium cataractarum]KAJ5359091.1 hypothetical protein N7496_011504 [Penicillium cataractarum]
MQLTSILGLCLVGLASSAAAMPRLAGPYHGKPLAVHVPVNVTTAHKATTTGTPVTKPLTTGTASKSNGTHHSPKIQGSANLPNHIKLINHCSELCSLEAQTCNVAVPDDDKFCWQTYLRCIDRCRPDDFQ